MRIRFCPTRRLLDEPSSHEDLQLVRIVHRPALGDACTAPLDAIADVRNLVLSVVEPGSPHTDRTKRERRASRVGLNARLA